MDRLCDVDAAFRPLAMALNRRRFGSGVQRGTYLSSYLMTYMHMYTVVYCRETERCVVVRVCRWFWMAVRFVCVIRVPVCARVCPGFPRCLFRYCTDSEVHKGEETFYTP